VGATWVLQGPQRMFHRIGDPEPVVHGVIVLRQTFDLDKITRRRWPKSSKVYKFLAKAGIHPSAKFSIPDIFDANTYSHDPRSQFMNPAIMSAGVWDYPVDTKGLALGGAANIFTPKWSFKWYCHGGATANGPHMMPNITKANALTFGN